MQLTNLSVAFRPQSEVVKVNHNDFWVVDEKVVDMDEADGLAVAMSSVKYEPRRFCRPLLCLFVQLTEAVNNFKRRSPDEDTVLTEEVSLRGCKK